MKKILIVALALVLALTAFAGCQKEEAPVEAADNTVTEATAEPVAELDGKVVVDGSGTVYPLMSAIAVEYMTNVQPNVSVQVGRAGSSAGFKKFIPGETDFSDASRKIKDKEVAQLEENGMEMGVDVLEFMVAYDGLTIVINKDNTWAVTMTPQQIIDLYLASVEITTWADIDPTWPADEIKLYGPNENHGTNEYFVEKILDEEPMLDTVQLEQEYSTLVDLVSKDVNAIAFFGYGYFDFNRDKINAVSVDFGNGPVAPSLETIGMDLDYAGFTRPVYTYLNVQHAKENPSVLDFAKFVVSFDGCKAFAGQTGFAPLPDSVYEEYQAQVDAIG